MPRPFFTARWQHLVLLNWRCPAGLLEPLVPAGTELDPWQGDTIISLVGFLFSDTRVLGFPIPGHRTFEEVNLRFYVRRAIADGSARRAVVFIREFVPRRAVAAVARWIYQEPYLAVPMAHRISLSSDTGGEARYSWRLGQTHFALAGRVSGAAHLPPPGSEAEFITQHHWGYTGRGDGGTMEYQVEHPPWRVWETASGTFEGPAERLYGPEFGTLLAGPPRSVFVGVGSEVAVHRSQQL